MAIKAAGDLSVDEAEREAIDEVLHVQLVGPTAVHSRDRFPTMGLSDGSGAY